MNRLLELTLLCAGIFVGALDQTVVVAALPEMIRDLRIPFTQLDRATWIVTGYLLGYTAAMPLAGQLADVYGPRRAYLFGLACFAAGSVGCALAPGLWPLVAARLVQAAGAGALVPAALAAAGTGGKVQAVAWAAGTSLGAVAAVAEAGSVLGPLYGAVVTASLGWRAIFWLNLPVAALVVAGLAWSLGSRPALLRIGRPSLPRGWTRIDWPGAILAGGGLAALTLALSDEARQPRPMAVTAGLLLAGGGLLAAFVWHERRTDRPLLDLRLFGRRGFSAANAVSLLGGAALIVPMVNVPLWAHTIAGRGTLDAGLLLMRMTVFIPVGALVGGLVTRHAGPRVAAVLGLAAAAAGLALMGRWTLAAPEAQLTRDLALAGFGFGVLVPPLTTLAIGTAGAAWAGAAAAMITVTRMLGMMLGLAALTSWGLRRFDRLAREIAFPVPQAGEAAAAYQERLAVYQQHIGDATLVVFHELFLVAAVVALAALVPALWLKERAGAATAPRSPATAASRLP